MNERLEGIKEYFGFWIKNDLTREWALSLESINNLKYLIQQAELTDKYEKRVEELKYALDFYANKKTYELGVNISMGSAHPQHEPIKYDKGEKARQALAGEPNET